MECRCLKLSSPAENCWAVKLFQNLESLEVLEDMVELFRAFLPAVVYPYEDYG